MSGRGKKVGCSGEGFSLIELILVISIISVLALMAVPALGNYIESARERVCEINRLQLQRDYEVYLNLKDVEHSDDILGEYLEEHEGKVCPVGGEISYADGETRCSEHLGEDDGEDVPYL